MLHRLASTLFLLFLTCGTAAAQQPYWVKINGPFGGAVVTAMEQSLDGTLLAGTAGGVYRSEDEGATWRCDNNGLPGKDVRAFLHRSDGTMLVGLHGDGVFSRTSESTRWLPTGLLGVLTTALAESTTGTFFAGTNGGLLRSFDHGLNWEVIDAFNTVFGGVISLAANHIYVFAGTIDGVYRSVDDGDSWEFVGLPGITDPRVETLAVNAQGDVYAGTSPSSADGSVYRSRNNGELWFRLQLSSDPFHVKALRFDENGVLYAGGYRKIYHSDNGGDSWQQAVISNTSVQAFAFTGQRVAAGTSGRGILRSYRGGRTWEEANDGIYSSINDVKVTPDGLVYAATAGGMYRSADRGFSWTLLNEGLTTLDVRTLAYDNSGRIIAGTMSGVFRLENDAWISISPPGNPSIRDLAVGPDGEIYAGFNRGVYRLNNPGVWVQIPIVGPDESYRDIIALAIDDAGAVYAGSYFDALRSTDLLTVWTPMDMFRSGAQVLAFDADGTLYAGTKWVGVLCSFDRGERWNKLINGLSGLEDIRSLGFDENGILHAGTYGSGVYHFHPWYQRWMTLNEGLDDFRVIALDFDDTGNGYAGTLGSGLFLHTAPSNVTRNKEAPLPERLKLRGNYPNPFNPNTSVHFDLPSAASVHLEVFDVLGQRWLTTPERTFSPGINHMIHVDGSSLPSGLYFYQITVRSSTSIWQATGPAVLVK